MCACVASAGGPTAPPTMRTCGTGKAEGHNRLHPQQQRQWPQALLWDPHDSQGAPPPPRCSQAQRHDLAHPFDALDRLPIQPHRRHQRASVPCVLHLSGALTHHPSTVVDPRCAPPRRVPFRPPAAAYQRCLKGRRRRRQWRMPCGMAQRGSARGLLRKTLEDSASLPPSACLYSRP